MFTLCDGSRKALRDLNGGDSVVCFPRGAVAYGGVGARGCCAVTGFGHRIHANHAHMVVNFTWTDGADASQHGSVAATANHLLFKATTPFGTAVSSNSFSYSDHVVLRWDEVTVGDVLTLQDPADASVFRPATVTAMEEKMLFGAYVVFNYEGDAYLVDDVVISPFAMVLQRQRREKTRPFVAPASAHDARRLLQSGHWIGWQGSNDLCYGVNVLNVSSTGTPACKEGLTRQQKRHMFDTLDGIPVTGTATQAERDAYFLNKVATFVFGLGRSATLQEIVAAYTEAAALNSEGSASLPFQKVNGGFKVESSNNQLEPIPNPFCLPVLMPS